VLEIERLRERHGTAVDRRDGDRAFASRRGREFRLPTVRKKQFIADLPAARIGREREGGRSSGDVARRHRPRRLGGADARLLAEVEQPVPPLKRIARRVDRHVAHHQFDAPARRNRIGLRAGVQHAAREHEQMREPQDRVAIASDAERAGDLDVVPCGIGRRRHRLSSGHDEHLRQVEIPRDEFVADLNPVGLNDDRHVMRRRCGCGNGEAQRHEQRN
jgi:hypothetical protein